MVGDEERLRRDCLLLCELLLLGPFRLLAQVFSLNRFLLGLLQIWVEGGVLGLDGY